MREKLKKITVKQKIVSVVVVIALIFGSTGGYYVYQMMNSGGALPTLDMASLYQDEIVQIGDIVVGLSESGSATLIYEEINIDAGYEVSEILVETSTYVEEGDIIAVLDLEASVFDEGEDNTALEEAEITLIETTMSVESQLLSAKATYDKSIASGESAQTIYNLAIQEIEDGLEEIEDNISEKEALIEDYQDQLANGLDSDYGLADAEADLSDAESTLTKAEAAYTTAVKALESAETAYAKVMADAGSTETEKTEANDTVLEKEILVASASSDITIAELAVASAEREVETAEESYDNAYIQMSSDLEIQEENLESLETSLLRYEASMTGDRITAQSTYDNSIMNYNNAYTIYEFAVEELEEQLAEAEALVEELTAAIEEGDEVDENVIIDENGNLLAPCTGYIMSVTEPTTTTIANTTTTTGLSITMSDNAYAQIDISVSQDDIADISLGMVTNVVFDAYEDIIVESEVTALSLVPSSDIASSVNYTVTIMCNVPEDITVFSEMSADVTFVQAQQNDVMVISSNYIVYEDSVAYVYVEESDGTITKTAIETGFSDGFDVEIISGVEEGDIILNESAVMNVAD